MTRIRVRGWWLLVGVATLLMVTPWPDWMIEWAYSRGLYPRIQAAVTTLSNTVSFAVIDVMVPAGVAYLLWRIWRLVGRTRERGFTSAVWEASRRVVRTSACLVLAFVVLWGWNYRRSPLEQVLRDGQTVVVSTEDVQALAEASVTSANQMRPAEVAVEEVEYVALATALAEPFQQALRALSVSPLSVPGRPKISKVLTPFFTAAGVTGMVNPLALESIVHPDLLPFERPMVLAHEWAHLAGFADEADASAVAWLACTLGGGALKYSADFFVVLESASAVPPGVWRELRARLSPGVVRDIQALAQRLTLQQPEVRETAFKVYDGYLRSNQVPDGVRSYSRALRVLVAMRAKGLAQ